MENSGQGMANEPESLNTEARELEERIAENVAELLP
jgi:hypothetical protein